LIVCELRRKYPLDILLDISKTARSSYYYHVQTGSVLDKYDDAKKEISRVYHVHKGRYGYRRITLEMKSKGYMINHKTVSKLMGSQGLRSMIRRKRYNSYKGETSEAAPNLFKQNFAADKPDMKWATDVTEFKVKDKKVYLSPIIELFNGQIISYNISESPNFKQVSDMLQDAFKTLKGDQRPTLHSDQGWQYRMTRYKQMLSEQGITQSMSRKGNCYDNAIIENFFGTIKSEMFYLKKYTSVDELKKDIKEYIRYYNNDRIKLNLNGMSPIKYRAHHYN
jgi:putative transposase